MHDVQARARGRSVVKYYSQCVTATSLLLSSTNGVSCHVRLSACWRIHPSGTRSNAVPSKTKRSVTGSGSTEDRPLAGIGKTLA